MNGTIDQKEYMNISFQKVLDGTYADLLKNEIFQDKYVPIIIRKMPYTDCLGNYREPYFYTLDKIKKSVNFIKNIKNDKMFLLFLKNITSTGERFGLEVPDKDYELYYDNIFIAQLFKYQMKSGKYFHEWIGDKLEKVIKIKENKDYIRKIGGKITGKHIIFHSSKNLNDEDE